MLPLGLDSQFNYVVLTTGVVNIGVGIVLASKYGATGMAVSAIVAQTAGMVLMEWLLRRARLSLFAKRREVTVRAHEPVAEAELVTQE
jgi:peptidoglycan biosynthesis protein MviN/MurJ (putative lipid II flippase)